MTTRWFAHATILLGGMSWLGFAQHGYATEAASTHKPVSRTDAYGVEQVWVPAGRFTMGSSPKEVADLLAANPPGWVAKAIPNEAPQRVVEISPGFWIDRFEVSNQAFENFALAGGYARRDLWSSEGWDWLRNRMPMPASAHCQPPAPQLPKTCVTWYEAQAYARWRGGALPTEAQWEYAARGPNSWRYPWGNEFDAAKAHIVDATGPKPVGSFPHGASWVGAMDMAGNAMEWVQDWLAPPMASNRAEFNPTGPAQGQVKVEKGGWWGSNSFVARAAYRHYEDPPDYADAHIGFRIVSAGNLTVSPMRLSVNTPLETP
jgi:formylglycine-generating enzyme required for sulfatase activity